MAPCSLKENCLNRGRAWSTLSAVLRIDAGSGLRTYENRASPWRPSTGWNNSNQRPATAKRKGNSQIKKWLRFFINPKIIGYKISSENIADKTIELNLKISLNVCERYEIIKTAIEEAGGSLSDVVRTRQYVTDVAVWEEVGRAHGEFFADIQPASTMVIVKGLVREEWLVEIEAEAIVG